MANQLDELNGPVNDEGRDINVISKQIPVKVGAGSVIFEILLWVLGIIPGVVFLFKKINAATYLRQLEQKIQQAASQVDNYLEQRVQILSNLAKLVDKAVKLDKDTFVELSAARSGSLNSDGNQMTSIQSISDTANKKIQIAIEAYPELKGHQEINEAIEQNAYLQKEITAARDHYNDVVAKWNNEIQIWPTKMIVAAKNGYTTRVPFAASKEVKEKARGVFF